MSHDDALTRDTMSINRDVYARLSRHSAMFLAPREPSIREIMSTYRWHAAVGTALGLGIGAAIKPIAAVFLIIGMALNAL